MTASGPKKEDLAPFTPDQKANPLGAHLLQNYYTHKNRGKEGNFPIFNINSPKDIPLILHCAAQEGLDTFGIVVMTGGRHSTPIMINKNKAYIFESLGVAKSKVGVNSVAQIAIGLSRGGLKNENISTFKDNRQVDKVSCGSDSFIALKQAFRIAASMDTFSQAQTSTPLPLDNNLIIDTPEKTDPFYSTSVTISQLDNLPPEVAKYSQAQSAIDNYPSRKSVIKASHHVQSGTETVEEYAQRHFKEIAVGEKTVRSNIAVESRRNKHAKLLTQMVNGMSVPEITEAIKDSSGINLILKHCGSIPPALIEEASTGSPPEPPSVLIQNYINQEMAKKRDDKGAVPEGSLNLRKLAYQLKVAKKFSAGPPKHSI